MSCIVGLIPQTKGDAVKNKRKENSVRNLIGLYTVVIGVALSLSIVSLIDPSKGLESLASFSALLFVALIATILPFYHGALRHLDDAYVENENQHIKTGALIIDFGLLFFHGVAFVVLSSLLSKPGHFIWTLNCVLVIDIAWGIFVHYCSSSQGPHGAEGRWAFVNFLFVAVSSAYLVLSDIYLQDVQNPVKLSLIIVIACVARTVVDYVWCRSFYFPKDD